MMFVTPMAESRRAVKVSVRPSIPDPGPAQSVIRSQWPRTLVLPVLAMMLCVVSLVALGQGAVDIPLFSIVGILSDDLGFSTGFPYAPMDALVVESIRLPRILMGILVGASLALSGAAIQGMFRNPLADPALLGISSGAALAAVTVIVLSGGLLSGIADILGVYLLPLSAFLGSITVTLIVYRFATVSGHTAVTTLLLAGIAIAALTSAGTGLLTYAADDMQLRTLTFWSMGSLGGATWEKLTGVSVFLLFTLVAISTNARALNAMLLGESEALHLGFDLERIKRRLIILVALSVGASVSVTGIIGFIGLVTPHLLRLAIGPDHRLLLPASAFLGAILLILADLFARTAVAPAELPIGIVTALIGGPFFLWLLIRYSSRAGF